MNSTELGKNAEKIVAKSLQKQGHKILHMNWRTLWCEVDIISVYADCVYFTEVKFRSSHTWGDGLAYITDKKLKQMQFAADFWLHENDWTKECCLQAASVDSIGNIEVVELA